MEHLLKGLGVALITPFRQDYKVDYKILEERVEEQISGGTDYIVALGTTGETPTLSDEEQKEIISCICKTVNKRVPVILGIGGNDPTRVIKNIENTNFENIQGILSVTPFYNKPSQKGLVEYYKKIAAVSPVPIILYNVPGRTGTNMLSETTIEIAKSCSNVIAVKEASGICGQAGQIAKDGPANFGVISGDDGLTLPIMSVGGIGVISVLANALPKHMSLMVHLANEGNFISARKIHMQLLNFFKLLFKEGNPCGIKALLEIMGKANNVLRLPLYPISKELYNDIEKEIKKII